jgi:DNA (cytosine-5)-methyltransferase 1
MQRRLTFIDLFAGIGGFHHAAMKVFPSAECVLAVEWDKDCQKIYSATFPEANLRGDIREVLSIPRGSERLEASAEEIRDFNLVPEHDVLFAGFPCQPFSKGGAQKGMSEQTQGTLFHEIMRIVEARRPPLVILENVANLVGHDEGRTWDTIIESLRAANYAVDREPLLISPHEIKKARGGAPQNRPRVYIVAVDSTKGLKVPDNSNLLDTADWRTASSPAWNIETIFKGSDPEETQLDEKELNWLEAWDDFVKLVPADNLPGFPIWFDAWYGEMRKPGRVEGSSSTLRAIRDESAGDEPDWWKDFVAKNERFYRSHAALLDAWAAKWKVIDFPESRRKLEWQARRHHPTREGRTLRDCLIQFRPSGIRVKAPTYAPALVAMAQTPIVGLGDTWRRIGPAEAGVLQGFTNYRPWRKVLRNDPSFRAGAAYKQFGNAVNIGVAALVLKRAASLFKDLAAE